MVFELQPLIQIQIICTLNPGLQDDVLLLVFHMI